MLWEQIIVDYDPYARPQVGALASNEAGNLGILTEEKGGVWHGVPVGACCRLDEKYGAWTSRRPVVIGYVDLRKLPREEKPDGNATDPHRPRAQG